MLWHNLSLLHQRKKSHKNTHSDKRKMKTAENTKSRSDDKTRSGEAIKVEERHAELERKIKYKAEIAVITQKPKMTESLTMSKQAEGVADAGITALPQWNEDTNAAATVKKRSGRLVAKAAAAHHSNGNAFADPQSSSTRMEDLLWEPQQRTIWMPT